jgi:amino acid transporter
MSVLTSTAPQSSAVAAALRRNSLGIPSISFFLLSLVGPLLVVAGVVPTFFAVTGLVAAPIFFLAVGVVLGLFVVGYVAMSQKITNAGAFYAFVRFGLGRPLGVAAALVALAAYNMLQVGAYGMFGPSMRDWAADNLGWHLPWWAWALIAWAVVFVLGLREVKLSARVLAVLSLVEIVVIIALSVVGLAHPVGGQVSFTTLSPTNLLVHGVGAAGVMATLGFVGFENAPVFAEEAKDHRRTVAVATYLILAGITLVYVVASLAMTMHYGAGQVVSVAGQQGPGMLFALGGSVLGKIGQALFLTSLFAALLAYHNAVGRYEFSLGRESVLPKVFGLTGRRSGAPWVASLAQSTLAFVVIVMYAWRHWDPTVKLFFWWGTTGGFGVLALMALTSIAVIAYFARDPQGEPAWRRAYVPAIAAALLVTMVVIAVANYATLLGVPPGSLPAKLLPASFLIPTVIGLIWAVVLKLRRNHVYDGIGLGPAAAAYSGAGVAR